jgi:hypothetical protein
MRTLRTRAVASIAIILALATAPVLSGCSVQSIIENATGGQVDVGGKSVPDDFPAEVPLIDGEVVYGGGLGSGEGKVWNVTIKVADLSAFDTISASLTEAGFTPPPTGSGELEGGIGGAFENAKYGLLVVVSKDGSDGFVANYTVTTKSP